MLPQLNRSSDPRTLNSPGYEISGNTQWGAHHVAPGELSEAFTVVSFPKRFPSCFPTVGLTELNEYQIWPLTGVTYHIATNTIYGIKCTFVVNLI